MAIFNSRWDITRAMLTPGNYVPLSGPIADAWRRALNALKSGNPTAKRNAIHQIIALLDSAVGTAWIPPNEELTSVTQWRCW